MSWAVVFGLISRIVSSLLRDPVIPDAHKLEVYVDDPVLAIRGTEETQTVNAAIAILGWAICGVKLAIRKGQIGTQVDWIGATFRIEQRSLVAEITAARLEEMRELTNELLRNNVVKVSVLRTYTGEAQSIAGLLYMWRPFVHMLYAALGPGSAGDAPPNCRWKRQILIPLTWIKAFLCQLEPGLLRRRWTVDSYLQRGAKVVVTTDVSPWGLGAVLEINGLIVSRLSSAVTTTDRLRRVGLS